MALEYILILFGTGIFAGFGAGLLGLGGGFFMTPVQYSVYSHMGLPTDLAVKMAFGTTLLVILPTAISGAWGHQRRESIWWRAAIFLGIIASVGSFIGAMLTTYIPGSYLKIAFGALGLAASARMFTGGLPATHEEPRSNPWLWVACAFPIGLITGILGIGGGVMVLPVLVIVLRFQMHAAVGTSLAMMIFTSIGGSIGYIINGMGIEGRPIGSLGYVGLPAWGLLTVSSIAMAQLGAWVSHRTPANRLRYIFAILILYVGLRMIGVFEWLGWPI